MTALIKPSKEAQKMADEMGIKFDAAAIKSAGGLREFLTQLDTAVEKYAESSGVLEKEVYGRLFGSAEALRALSPLTGQLAGKFGENVDAMADSAGTMDQAYETMNSGAAAATQKIMNMVGGWMDSLAALNGNYMAILNVASSMGVLVMSLFTVGKGLWAAIAAARTFCTQIGLTAAVQKVAGACSVRFGAMLKVLSANMKGVAVSARTMKLAIEGALITTGVGAALVVLSELVSGLASATDDAADSMEGAGAAADTLKQAEDAYAQTVAEAQIKIDKEIAELKKLIDTKADTTAAVNHLNSAYGKIFGTYKTANEWYKVLTKNGKAYCQQLGIQAQLMALTQKMAENQAKLDVNYGKRRELWASGKAKKEKKVLSSAKGADGKIYPTQSKVIVDTPEMAALRDEARPLIAENKEVQAQVDALTKRAGQFSFDLTVDPDNTGGGGGKGGGKGKGNTAPEDKRTEKQKLKDTADKADNKIAELTVNGGSAEEIAKQTKIRDEARAKLKKYEAFELEESNPKDLKSIEDYEKRLSYIGKKINTAQDDTERKYWQDERKKAEDALEKMKGLSKVAPVLGQQKTLADYDSAIQFYTDEQRNADVSNITELQKTIDTLNKQKDAMMLGTQIPEMQKALDELGTRGTKEYTLKIQSVGIDTVRDKIKELNTLLEDTALTLPGAWRDALNALLAQWQGVAADLSGVEEQNKKLEGLKSAASSVDQLAQSFSKLSSESKGLATAMQSVSLAATFTQIIATMVSKSKNSLTVWDWIAGITAGTAAAISSITALKGVAFAEGGIVHGPTLGLVGEYPGASSNPEVIAPLNKLRSLIGEDSGYGEVRFEIAGDRLEGVLKRRQKLHNRR